MRGSDAGILCDLQRKKCDRLFSGVVDSLSGIIIGIVFAYILIPLMEGMEKKILVPIYKKRGFDVSFSENADPKKRSQMRKISLTATMVIALALIYSLFSIILPQLISSVREITYMLPVYIKKLDDYSNLFCLSFCLEPVYHHMYSLHLLTLN